jgi:hypothetical protein
MDNRDANHLAWVTTSRALMPPDVIVERLAKPSIKTKHQDVGSAYLLIIDGKEPNEGDNLMQSIRTFLENWLVPDDNVEAERVACKSYIAGELTT